MLVDYHFHPNLSKYDWLAKRKCLKIWERFAETQLDVVVVTEHVFKNPARAYRLLAETRPTTATTVIFPGIEALTNEDIDMIIFAQDEHIFTHQKLMVPKQLTQLGMIAYLKQQPELVGSVAHPALLGHSGSERRVGKAATIEAIQRLGGAEISNACFNGIMALMRWCRMQTVFGFMRRQMLKVETLPKEYYDFPAVKLYTGGSDAHVLSEIGSGMVVNDASLQDRAAVFTAISHNRNTEFLAKRVQFHPYLALYKSYSVAREALVKAFRLYEDRLYQNDDMFTNFYSEAEKEAVQEIEKRRTLWLKHILNMLTYFSFTPKALNILSVGFLLASVSIVYANERWSVICFIMYLLCNSLTGPLARYQEQETETQALTKIVLYQLALGLVMFAAMALGWVDNWLGALYLVSYIIMLWLTIALNKIGQPVRLIIRSINVVLAGVLLKITTGIDWLNYITLVFAVYMVGIDTYMVIRLLLSTSKKRNQQS